MSRKDTISNVATVILVGCALVMTFFFVRDRVSPKAKGPAKMTLEGIDPTLSGSDWAEAYRAGRSTAATPGPVQILVFEDFQCPSCVFFKRALAAVMPGHQDVTVSVRHWPLEMHPAAMPLAIASECAAEQGKFWDFHAAAYEAQDSLKVMTSGKYAALVPLTDPAAFERCVADRVPADRIARDIAAAKAIDARGTPAILVNGRMLPGVPDSSQLETIIGQALKLGVP